MEVKDMTEDEILECFENKYIKVGRSYSGMIPANATIFYYNEKNYKKLIHLSQIGKLIIRNCKGHAFELPLKKRLELNKKHNLSFL